MGIKYKQLAELLREELNQAADQSKYKFPTEAELSARYHMSRQTVRHALQLLVDEGLAEKRQGSGTYGVKKNVNPVPGQIAVITSFLDEYIFPPILHDAQAVFASHNYSTLVYATENQVSKERDILLKLLEQPVSGILVEGSKTALPSPNSDLYQKLRQSNVPMVFLHGAYAELSGIPCVCDDNFGGGYQLSQYLISKGHRQFAGIFKSDDVQGPQRYYGAISAIRDAKLPLSDHSFYWYDTHTRLEMLEKKNTEFLRRFIQQGLNGATAVICYNDEIAYLLIRELLSAEKRVPEDVAVVSFDNSYYSQIGPVHITSLWHKDTRMGRAAAEQLINILQGRSATSLELSWELIERRSG